MAVKSRLKERMEARDLTQLDVAAGTGLSPTIIGRLFHNSFKRLDNKTVELVCNFFGVGLGDMFYIDNTGVEE
jgi:transcriptional regulator with XRE-family HTH domain